MRGHRTAPPAVLAAVLTALLLGGCSGGGVGSESSAGAYPGTADAVAPAAGAPEDDRHVVTTADTTVVLADPAAGAQRVSELTEDTGGRVEQRSEQTLPEESGGTSSADLVLRVPADELTGLLDELADLGEVASVSITRDDVTSTAVDLDARISAMQTSVARLQTLLAGSATTADLLAVEELLAERQGELEAMQAQRVALADQVELTTLAVHLVEPAAAPGGEGPDGFLGGLGTGWHALAAAGSAVLVVLGVLVPWLAVAAVVAALAVPVVRRTRRRRVRTAPPAV